MLHKKLISRLCIVSLALCTFSLFSGCSDEEDKEVSKNSLIKTLESEDIGSAKATLCASVPVQYKDNISFEVFTDKYMSSEISFTIISTSAITNSSEEIADIKWVIGDLIPNTTYYARALYTADSEVIRGNLVSFSTSEPQQMNLQIGQGIYKNNTIRSFDLNLLLNTGTISGEPEEYYLLGAIIDSNNKISNLSPIIHVWDDKEVSGEIYAVALQHGTNSSTIRDIDLGTSSTTPSHKTSDLKTLYFSYVTAGSSSIIVRKNSNFYWDVACATTNDFTSPIDLNRLWQKSPFE